MLLLQKLEIYEPSSPRMYLGNKLAAYEGEVSQEGGGGAMTNRLVKSTVLYA
jgi:hypothetical protein